MLLSLTSHPNPAQILISAIQKRGGAGLISKEEDFYLALLNPASEGGGIREAVKIMGGDPGKGALSLEMEDSLVQGQAVQVSFTTRFTSGQKLIISSCRNPRYRPALACRRQD
jgi:hypothetical protein